MHIIHVYKCDCRMNLVLAAHEMEHALRSKVIFSLSWKQSIYCILLIDRKFLLAIIIMYCYFRQECENAGGTESGSCADGTH